MSVYRSNPSSCILTVVIDVRLILRILAVTAVAFAVSFLSALGSIPLAEDYFAAVTALRDPIPVARELLLVQYTRGSQSRTGSALEPADLLWTLAEFRAERVLVSPSVEPRNGPSDRSSDLDSEFQYRLDQEFTRIDDNIVALFEAIRIGSIEPREADRFIQQLRELVANSKSRVEDGVQQSADGGASWEDLIGAFGGDRVATDLASLGVALPRYDWADTLPVPPREADGTLGFRRVSSSSIRRYISVEDRLSARLDSLEEAGYLDETAARYRPSVLRDHARSLRRELYEEPTERRVMAWREARQQYFEAVAEVIDTDSENRLIERLGTLGETPDLEEESAAELRDIQEDLAGEFGALRSDYATLSALRDQLSEALGGSFVILDSGEPAVDRVSLGSPDAVWLDGLTEGEYQAAIANSSLVGEHLRSPDRWYRILLLTGAGFVVGLMLAPFRAGVSVALSPVIVLPAVTLFPVLFLVADIWIDPISAVMVLVGAVVASAAGAFISQSGVEQTVTGRAALRIPLRVFRRTIRGGSLPADVRGRRRAVVVAIAPETRGEANDLDLFHRRVSVTVRRLGGMIVGEEGPTVFAVFETSPGDHAVTDGSPHAGDVGPTDIISATVKKLTTAPENRGTPVRCGVEVGELLFYVSPIGGFRATGRAMTYARHLGHLARKHSCHALFGAGVVSACRDDVETLRFQERGRLSAQAGGEPYAFYSLREIDPPSP
jgi:hypothetical protein